MTSLALTAARPIRRAHGRRVIAPCLAGLLALGAAVCPVAAQTSKTTPKTATKTDPRWTAVARALGREGETEDGYYRVQFPRSDFAVRIGDHTLASAFDRTSYFAFAPTSTGRVLVMGEIVLHEDEVNAVMAEARRQGLDVPAVHNHLLGETPRLVFVHVMASGEAGAVGQKLRALLARTATPTGPAPKEAQGAKAAWASVSAVLGEPEEVAEETAEWVFPRRDHITEGGVAVKSTGALETASEVVFQRLAAGRAATTGEMFLAASEITPVRDALEAGGVHVTAIHTHMAQETPRLCWLHWYGVGDPAALARTVHTAVTRTNSAPQSEGKGGR